MRRNRVGLRAGATQSGVSKRKDPMTEMTFALLAFLFPLAWSPGPGNLFFAAGGARFGVAATLPANGGYHAATWVVTVAVGFGFALMAGAAPGMFEVVRLLGAAYVMWLAWKLLRAGVSDTAAEARPAGFGDGALLLVLNPKAYLIIALMFSQFIGQGGGTTATVLWIATVFTLNNLVAFLAWTLLGDRIGVLFRDRAGAKVLNTVFGLLLAAVGLWIALG